MTEPDDDPQPPASARGPRWPRPLLLATLPVLCWLSMQVVHEAGHVLGAWATGGRVTLVSLPPLGLSRTDVDPNPSPLVVVWAGPLVGVLLPLAVWAVAARLWPSPAYLFQFFAAFCLVANGAYVGSGVWFPAGDAATMLRLHPALWPLALFGLATLPAGLVLWHGQSPHFGLGPTPRPVPPSHALTVTACLAVLFIATFLAP